MKSFFKNVVQRKDGPGLVGRMVKVGSYMVRVEALLGEGGFASIYRVRDSNTNRAYALKHMRLAGEQEALNDCHTEVEAMKLLAGQPYILPLKAVAFTGARGAEQEAYLLLELCQENLVEYMSRKGPVSDKQVVHLFQCACRAVAALHLSEPPMAHRDLKAENLLLDSNQSWLLCDFGSVISDFVQYESSNQIMLGEEVMRRYTTPAYRAPEMWDLYSRERIDTKADIWALGCLLFYIMYGKLAFGAEAKLQILNGDFAAPATRPQPMVALLHELLVTQPAKRPDIMGVLERVDALAASFGLDSGPEASGHSEGSLHLHAPATQLPPAAAPAHGLGNNNGASAAASFTSVSSWQSSPSHDGNAGRAQQPAPPPEPPQATFIAFDDEPPPPSAPAHRHGGAAAGGAAALPAPPRPHPPHQVAPERVRPGRASGDVSSAAQPPASPSSPGDSSDMASLRRQLAEAKAQIQSLAGALRSSQAQVKQLQVETANQAAQLRRQQSPAQQGELAGAGGSSAGGWVASFDGSGSPTQHHPITPAASFDRLTHHTETSAPSSRHSSPARTASPHRIPSGMAGASPLGNTGSFDPFGITEHGPAHTLQTGDADQEQHGPAPLKFDAFGEDEFDEDATTPLAAGGGKGTPHKVMKMPAASKAKVRLKGLHRRTSSEPTPVDSWHLTTNADWPAN